MVRMWLLLYIQALCVSSAFFRFVQFPDLDCRLGTIVHNLQITVSFVWQSQMQLPVFTSQKCKSFWIEWRALEKESLIYFKSSAWLVWKLLQDHGGIFCLKHLNFISKKSCSPWYHCCCFSFLTFCYSFFFLSFFIILS